jgi:hypothetical protein
MTVKFFSQNSTNKVSPHYLWLMRGSRGPLICKKSFSNWLWNWKKSLKLTINFKVMRLAHALPFPRYWIHPCYWPRQLYLKLTILFIYFK